MRLAQDGEGGGQSVVERTDLEQRKQEKYTHTHIYTQLHYIILLCEPASE